LVHVAVEVGFISLSINSKKHSSREREREKGTVLCSMKAEGKDGRAVSICEKSHTIPLPSSNVSKTRLSW